MFQKKHVLRCCVVMSLIIAMFVGNLGPFSRKAEAVVQYTITCYRQKYASYGTIKSFKANSGTSLLSNANLPKAPAGYTRSWRELGTDRALNSYTLVKSNMSIYPVDTPITKGIIVNINGTKKVYNLKTGQRIESVFKAPSYLNRIFVGWGTSADAKTGIRLPSQVCCFTNSTTENWYPIYTFYGANAGSFTLEVNYGDLDRLYNKYRDLVSVLKETRNKAKQGKVTREVIKSAMSSVGSALTLVPLGLTVGTGLALMFGSTILCFLPENFDTESMAAEINAAETICSSIKHSRDTGATTLRIYYDYYGELNVLP